MVPICALPGVLGFLGHDRKSTTILVLVAILLRVLTGLSSYSGAGDAPKYGDYEAQRHWMELTINLPVSEWYTDSPHNNATYWPLDYPPLSGYQSWLCGLLMRAWEPASVALGSSRGYETPSSKLLMRATVIVADLLVYIPAVLYAVHVFYDTPTAALYSAAGRTTPPAATRRPGRTLALAALLFNPSLLLIDHGHFQYNGISLGCTLAAMAAISAGRRLVGSVLFVAALNHKQMSLFFAPAFFAHLLGWALHDPAHTGLGRKFLAVAKLGVTVIAAFAVCWAPYLTSKDAVLQVLTRIFPVRRGLFEDYVANWWCASSLLVKWKTAFPPHVMLRAAAGATLAAAAPAMLHQLLRRPTPRGLVWCTANCAFAFFMFSYQVHEKSILLPLLPLTLLAGDERVSLLAAWLPVVGAFSMYPLLVRDGVALPYIALTVSYAVLMAGAAVWHTKQQLEASHKDKEASGDGRPSGFVSRLWTDLGRFTLRYWDVLSLYGVAWMVALHAARELLPPPDRLPWLHDRLFITFAFIAFAKAWVYLQVGQWQLPAASGTGGKKKQQQQQRRRQQAGKKED